MILFIFGCPTGLFLIVLQDYFDGPTGLFLIVLQDYFDCLT
jgi:hypothetical protein